MRKIGLFMAMTATILLGVSWVEGQQDEKKKGGGKGGFGGFGGLQQRLDPLALLRNASVKKELDVTEEQMEKLSPEILAAIGKVLNEKQMTRFRQIELQERKNDAFKDDTVQSALKMTAEQKKSINTILEDSKKETTELFKAAAGGGGGGGGFQALQANREKADTITKEAKEKIYAVLTSEQRKTWRGLVGEEFKIERGFGGFGGAGGGGGFGKGKKKTDN